MPPTPLSDSDDDRDVPRGLVFPSMQRSPSRRRWRLFVIGVVLLAGVSLVWPVYPAFRGIRPFVLGLPLSLAWVVGWLAVVFVALGALYVREEL